MPAHDHPGLPAKLQLWHDQGKHEKIISALDRLPREAWDARLGGLCARALNNLGRYQEALDLLLQHRAETEAVWHFRVGYALYYLEREAEAAEYLQKAIDLGDDDPDTLELLNWSLRAVRAGRGLRRYHPHTYAYSEEELNALNAHIERHFGPYRNVLQELVSPDIHVDILILDPIPERPYYTLISQGMGARSMKTPPNHDPLRDGRAELLICLPPDWPTDKLDMEEHYWPIGLMKTIARFPIRQDEWLGYGYSIANSGGRPLIPDTEFRAALLCRPEAFAPESFRCALPDDSLVNFFQVIPLYNEEVQFKLASGTDMLLSFLDREERRYIRLDRPSVCE
ncbi:MAG: suppressor of fused domain protein [Desulfovibrionaceae bacterium]|nr:suppressor of fused domain protein [Desulfovibrionaceae bacterium]